MAHRFRKKPVVIEAMRCTLATIDEVAAWCGGQVVSEVNPRDHTDVYTALKIPTLEGTMTAQTHSGGDWVIRGVKGEFYPCKPDIFDATYEPEEAPLTGEAAIRKTLEHDD